MSLYALLPGPSPSSTAIGSDLVQTLSQQQPSFTEDEKKANIAKKEKVVMLDMTSFHEDGMIPRSNSLSSISDDGGLDDDDDVASLSESNKQRILSKESQWVVHVEEAMINYKNLVKPPRNTGRASVARRSRDSRLIRRRGGKESTASSFDLDPTEKAIEFRLVISYGGRRYCTTRSLLQIAQCRHNLVEELQWNSRSNKLDASGGTDDTNIVPEIPRMGDSMFCGAGFTQMSGMLDSYKAALEQWFKDALAVVSDENPILSDFLWESLDCTCNMDTLHARLTDLGAINESLNVSGHSMISYGSFAEE